MFRCEGIILQTTPFSELDWIFTVFTLEYGLIKLFVKNGRNPKRYSQASSAPLTKAEFIVKKGNSTLWTCQEITPINLHLKLRQNLQHLTIACELLHTIKSSQLPEKPAPLLFRLLCLFLENLNLNPHPENFAGSFYLKVLAHEGLWPPKNHCTNCEEKEAVFITEERSYCYLHAPVSATPFSKEEWALMTVLKESRSFSEISKIPVPKELGKKIKIIFNEKIAYC